MTMSPARKSGARRLGTLLLLFVLCVIIYYLGEIIDFLGWRALRWEFFYGVHDVHRLLFLAPIVYAGHYFGSRAAVIITIIAVNTFLPRALLISPFPDPLLRTILFIIIAGVMGYLTGSESEKRRRLEVTVEQQRASMLGMAERLADGVLIVAPDGRIRFTSSRMVQDFGDGTGSSCQEYLRRFGTLATEICEAPLAEGTVGRWEGTLADGRTCELFVALFVDHDGKPCRLITLRGITGSGTR